MTELIRVARNLHVPGEALTDLEMLCGLALESSASDSVFAFVTAARLHELWLPPLPDGLDIATASPGLPGRAMTRTRRPEIKAHRLQLAPDEIMSRRGIPMMTIARTWQSLGSLLPVPDLVAAGDSALRAGATLDELVEMIARRPRARGARALRAALPLLDARSRSRGESHLRVAVSAPDIPRFEVNVPVSRDEGGWLAEPDLSLEEAKLALEYQGKDHALVKRMRRDLTRFKDFRDERWLCLPYGPAQTFGRPWEIRAEVRRELGDRAPHLLGKRRPPPRPRVVT